MLTTNQKGAIAETAIAHEALRLGFDVFRSYADARYDLIFDLHPRLVRVQCKWAAFQDGTVLVRLYSARRTAGGLTRRLYSSADIDAFAAYCPETGRCYSLDMERLAGRSQVILRTGSTRNNQQLGVNWASDYEFDATLGRVPGPIAQLGERPDGIRKVVGSSPTGSISLFDADQGRR